MPKNLKIGFIGLGLMGRHMALNIHKKGYSLAVFNRTKRKTLEFQKMGCVVYDSPGELAAHADVIISMVTGPSDVREIYLGKNGVIKGAKIRLIAIDMGTIGPTAAVSISKELEIRGIDFLDAPVTGSVPKATTGELTIFIGGRKEIFVKVKPVLYAMGKNLQYIGQTGLGQAIKLINNLLVAISLSGLAESMLLSDALNLGRTKTAEVLSTTPVFSPYLQMKLPNLIANNHPTIFSVKNMHKDLKLMLSELKKTGRNLPVLTLVERLYARAIRKGLGDKDLSAVLEVL